MERGASWSQQLGGNFAKRTPVFWMYQVFMAVRPFFHRIRYADFKEYLCAAVCSTVVSHVTVVRVW